ncbi:MAG: accessory gene regulator B family protein [Syntrophomonas sp.]
MSYMKFSTKWAANLGKIHHLGEEKQAVLAYAIEILTLNIVNTIFILTMGWIIGAFWGTLTCLLTIAAFRHNAGGGHSESPWRCSLVTIIVFPLLALASHYVSTWQPFYTDLLSLVSIVVGFAFIVLYAPVDNPKAPIISPVRRKRLKIIALLIMMIAAIIIVGLKFSGWENASEIRFCLVLSILWFSLNLTPLGNSLWCFIDRIGIKSGRRCTR